MYCANFLDLFPGILVVSWKMDGTILYLRSSSLGDMNFRIIQFQCIFLAASLEWLPSLKILVDFALIWCVAASRVERSILGNHFVENLH